MVGSIVVVVIVVVVAVDASVRNAANIIVKQLDRFICFLHRLMELMLLLLLLPLLFVAVAVANVNANTNANNAYYF